MQGNLISLLIPTFGKTGAEQASLQDQASLLDARQLDILYCFPPLEDTGAEQASVQVQASLLEAKAAVLACQKLRLPLLEPPAEVLEVATDPASGARKPQSSAAHLQQLAPQVCTVSRLVYRIDVV